MSKSSQDQSGSISIRLWQPSDIPALREIFSATFGDSPEEVDAFFRAFLHAPRACVLASVTMPEHPAGLTVSAVYCIPGPVLRFSSRNQVPSGYLYALGCLPAWRHRGIGMAVYREMLRQSRLEAPAACGIPADEGLVQAYDRIHPMIPLGRTRFAEFRGEALSADAPFRAEPISEEDYARRREDWLSSHPHAVYPDSWFRLMAEYGSLFLALPGALAAVTPGKDRCVVQELLCPDADPLAALSGIARLCPAKIYEVRTPVFFPAPGEVRRWAYYHHAEEGTPAPEDFWYPFGLE